MEALTVCPVCQQTGFTPLFSCKDFTVSHETFKLVECGNCGFVMTNPRPDEMKLPGYYQSETYISHSNKSANLIDRVYMLARTLTLAWKYKLISQHSLKTPLSILDFGCGTGAFLSQCKRHRMRISGVEPSPAARERASKETATKIHSTLDEITARFDVITLWHVLEHVSDLHATLKDLRNHLEENGTMFIAVPNLKSLDAVIYREHWAGYDVPRHLWHFSAKTMERVLHANSLKLLKILPMRLDSYYISWLSEKYKNPRGGFSGLVKGIIQGSKSNRAARLNGEYSSLIYIAGK